MRLFVTGGAGFIGANFVHHTLHGAAGEDFPACCPDQVHYAGNNGGPAEVTTFDALTYAGDRRRLAAFARDRRHRFVHGDVRDAAAVDAAIRAADPEAIVHFAAESHVDRSIESGLDFVTTNVVGTQVMLDAARRRDVPRFLHVSTDEVYGSTRDGSFHEGSPYDPSSPYSASKAGSDLLVLAHHRTYGLPVTITRCTNNYGPGQHPEKLLPKTILNALSGRPVPVYGDGRNVRDWLYVKDHCAALLHVLGLPFRGALFNIAGRTETANLDLVRRVLALLGARESLITFVPDRPGHDFRYSLDDRRLRETGWSPRVPLDAGLAETIHWYRSSDLPVETPTA